MAQSKRAGAGAVAIADGEQGADPGLIGTSDDFGAIGVEALAIEMSVGVGVHQKRYSLFANRFSASDRGGLILFVGLRDKVAVGANS